MFFVGAGISVDSGLPNFCEFSKVILEKIVPTAKNACCPLIVNDENIERIASALRPEVLLQTIYEIIGDNIFQFYDWLTSGEPNLYHYYLAAAIHCGHYVFTCNVDNLIEKAYKYLYPDEQLRVCVGGECDYTNIKDTDLHDTIATNTGILFKVHGSIEPEQQDQYKSIRFTLNQVGKGIPANIKKVLEKALQKYDCIFLGYSGCDHFSNQPVFNTTITSKKSYWLWWEGGQSVRLINAKQFFVDKQNKIDTHLKNGNPFFTFRRALEIKSVGEYFHQKTYRSEISLLYNGDIGLLLITLFPILKQQSNEFTNIDDFIRVNPRPAPEPPFLREIRIFDRLYAAAKIQLQRQELKSAEQFAEEALKCCLDFQDRIEILLILVDIWIGLSKNEPLIRLFDEIIRLSEEILNNYPPGQHTVLVCRSIIEVYVKRANYFRLKSPKDFDTALQTARDIIDKYRSVTSITDAESRLNRYEGLFLTRSGQKSENIARGIAKLEEEYKKTETDLQYTGDIKSLATALNSLGLAYHGQAESILKDAKNNAKEQAETVLEMAVDCLKKSKELHGYIADDRALYQNERNFALVYVLLGRYDEALNSIEDACRAFRFSTGNEFRNDKLTAYWSYVDIFVRLLNKKNLVDKKQYADKITLAETRIDWVISERRNDIGTKSEHELMRALDVSFRLHCICSGQIDDHILNEIVSFYKDKIDNDKDWFSQNHPYSCDNPLKFLNKILVVLNKKTAYLGIAEEITHILDELERIRSINNQ